MDLNGAYVTHLVFGRGQIIEQGNDFIAVLFAESSEKKKFIYPAALGTFLKLENAGTAKQFQDYTDEIARGNELSRKSIEDRLLQEKRASQERAKLLKKATKKPVKKAIKSIDE